MEVPLFYRGKVHVSEKSFAGIGQHRSCDPNDTYERMLPISKMCGVTRVADITGLDRIGVPVTSVIRPNSLTLSTASGKGITKKIAQVSGIMEAIELYHAENVVLESVFAPYNEISKEKHIIPTSKMQIKKNSLFNANRSEAWCAGWDIISQREIYVPLSSVSLRKIDKGRHINFACFQEDSNGLASGNNFCEALCSGILEVVERDAITCIEYAQEVSGYEPPQIHLDSISFPAVRDLLSKLDLAQVELSLYDCQTDTEVPVFKALVYDRHGDGLGPGGGYGAHLDPETAMIRAITEAIQGRAVVIAGSRDDVFRFDLFKINNSRMRDFRLEEEHRIRIPAKFNSCASRTFNGDIAIIVSKLKKLGVENVIVFDLNIFSQPFSVIKVLIPGLEGYRWKNSYTPSTRALNFAKKYQGKGKMSGENFFHYPAGGAN